MRFIVDNYVIGFQAYQLQCNDEMTLFFQASNNERTANYFKDLLQSDYDSQIPYPNPDDMQVLMLIIFANIDSLSWSKRKIRIGTPKLLKLYNYIKSNCLE